MAQDAMHQSRHGYQSYGTEIGPIAVPTRSSVSWGAVFSGTVIGSALMVLLSLLCYALASRQTTSTFSTHLGWWLGGSGIFATFVAGFLAAAFGHGRGLGVGVVQGMTVWGLLTLAVVIIVPGAVTAFRSLVSASPLAGTSTILWTSFWSVLAGLGAAFIGGLLGGAMPMAGPQTVILEPTGSALREPAPRHMAPTDRP